MIIKRKVDKHFKIESKEKKAFIIL